MKHLNGRASEASYKPVALKKSGQVTTGLSNWQRWAIPSIRDVLFIMLFTSLVAGGLSSRLLADGDIGWHIRNGEQIVESGSIPTTDPFSSTMQGHRWFAWEWLFDAAVGVLHEWKGLNAVVWLAALVISITFAGLLSLLLARGTNVAGAVILVLLAFSAATIHLFARPHIFSWLLVVVWVAILDGWQDARRSNKVLYVLPALMVVWVNVHGGFVLGLAILTCYWIGEAIECVRERDEFARVVRSRRLRLPGRVLLLCIVATLVNPYGYRLHIHIYRYLTNSFLMNHIDEFRSPDFHGVAQSCFAILVLGAIAMLASGVRPRISQLLLILFAIYSGLYASRNLPTAAILLALTMGPLWSQHSPILRTRFAGARRRLGSMAIAAVGRTNGSFRGHLWPLVIAAGMLVIVANGGWVAGKRVVEAQFNRSRFPVDAVSKIVAEDAGTPVFSPDYWGGYLIYTMYPANKVVVDDRHDLYGADFFAKYLEVVRVSPQWEEIAGAWGIQRVLMPRGSALENILRETQGWRVRHEDGTAVLFERCDRDCGRTVVRSQ